MEENFIENLEIYNTRGEYAGPIALTYIIFGLVSIPITFTVLYSTLKLSNKKMTIDLKISLCILIVDFIASSGSTIVGLMARYNGLYIVYHKWYCSITNILYINIEYLSIYYVGLMSLERGLLIIHNIKMSDLFWLGLMIGEFLYFSIISITAASWGQMGLVSLAYACMVTPNFELGMIITYSYFVLLAVNFICILYCYIGIAIKLRFNAWKNIRELNLNKEATLHQANRTIVKVLFLLIIYIISNGFELFNFLIEIITGETRPGINDFISTNLMLLGPIVNSIILVQFHDSVKLSLLKTFPFLKVISKYDSDTSLNVNQFNQPTSREIESV